MPIWMKEWRDKPFTVKDLIEHLKTLNPDLPVWYQMGNQEHFYPATTANAEPTVIAEADGSGQIEVCLVGDVP